jgi:pyruvate formate lyase activating enzyme
MASVTPGLVFNIQRYAIHDGSGVRTLVFMKGCPLRCRWCSNPEGQEGHPEIGFMASRCVGTEICKARCVAACPEQSITLSREGKATVDRGSCAPCRECSEACYYGALELIGREMTLAEVLLEVEKDRPFYRRSGGGVTVGGGEPLMQAEFVTRLLEACQARHLHTAVETTGFGSKRHLEAMLEHVDLVYFDVKHMDPARHQEFTGVPNRPILENLRAVLSADRPCEVIVRITTIPGVNDSEENISASARFAAELGCEKIELVPYHQLGVGKYAQYGREYRLGNVESPTRERMERLRRLVEGFGLTEMTGRM